MLDVAQMSGAAGGSSPTIHFVIDGRVQRAAVNLIVILEIKVFSATTVAPIYFDTYHFHLSEGSVWHRD